MTTSLPVIFLAFANEYQEGRYLHKLVEEHKQLYAALGPVSSNENPDEGRSSLCEIVVRQNATIKDIFDVFQKYGGRISIFHYGGHADGYQLLLQGKDGEGKIAHAGGLISLLSRRKSLKLVFLNGCSTQKFAQDLVGRGVPTVIGTATSIPDATALQISSRFYNGLAKGLTLAGAWDEAKAEVMTGVDPKDTHRGFQLREGDTGRFPWDVEFKDDAAKEIFNNWNLPGVANKPLFGLPDPKKQKLPSSPFLFLKPYGDEHAEIFFGRSYYIRDLFLKILEPNSPPIILLYGESGSGKSSLLDAGLQPRLATATDPETDTLLFDIRYERRDQELGLIGTLAGILSYFTLTNENEEEGNPVEEEEDPNLEKIQAIESIAKELEEDTASSFLNLIDRYKAIRAYQSSEEYRENLYRTGDLDEYAGEQLREAWLNIEKKTGRRLVIILDQVEELFTDPNPKMDKELEDLLQVLYDIFGTPAEKAEDQIRGKIILGYREEFNAKIEARIKDVGLARSTVFLEQLSKKDILDIFQGLESGVVKDHYNIAIEDDLPNHVANQLLKGKESVAPGHTPVAPVLQLLLTKLWNKAYRENNHQPAFTIDAYNEIQSQGKEMEEYFKTQMKKIAAWEPEVVESGLALDILAYHITDLGTSSKHCSIEDIRRRYRHLSEQYADKPDIVDQLVNRLKSSEIFLLNDRGRGNTSLPHDTLAPIIMREYNRSDKLGQRSARILDTKRPDFIRASKTKEDKKVRLDDNDLEVVTGGIKGMRALEEEEKTLLQISMEEREKRLRLRRFLFRGGIVAGLFILFLAIMAGMLSVSVTEQLKNAAIDHAHEESLKQQDNRGKDNYNGPELAHFAYSSQGKDKRLDVVQNYYRLSGAYMTNAPNVDEASDKRPVSLSLQPGARISSLNYHPSLGPLVSLQDGSVKYWPEGRKGNEKTIDVRSYLGSWFGGEVDSSFYNKLNAGYSADGKSIQVLFRFAPQPLYELAGKLVPAPTVDISIMSYYDEDYAYYDDEYDEDEEAYYYEEEEDYLDVGAKQIGYYNLFTGRFVDEFGLSYTSEEFYGEYGEVEVIVGESPIDVFDLFSTKLMDEESNLFRNSDYNSLKNYGWGIYNTAVLDSIIQVNGGETDLPLRATKNMTRGIYNSCLVWDPDELSGNSTARGFYDPNTLDYVSALTKDSFLTVGPDGAAMIRDTLGNTLVPLLGTGSGLIDISLSPDNRHFYAATKDSVVIWKLDGQRAIAYAHPNVRNAAFSIDGSKLVTQSRDKITVWSVDDNSRVGYPRAEGDHSIAFTRIQEDNLHLVIGVNVSTNTEKEKRFLRFFRKKKKNTRIDYWNIETGRVDHSFELSVDRLIDASVSPDGKFAVALEPGRASVIPLPKEKIRSWEYNSKGIEVVPPGKGDDKKQPQRVFLSPNGKYIVRQSPRDNRIELFNHKGKPVNAYAFQRYSQGFNGQLFSPDDHYLIAKKSDEVFYWHPEDDSIQWPQFQELSLGEKQTYNLTTFIDYIPGTKDKTKWWAIGILLVSLIYALLYFSGAIIQFVQQKSYLELGLYGASVLLLTAVLIGIWVIGTEDAAIKKVAFYGIVWATLGILAMSIYRSLKEGKYQPLIALGVVSLLLVLGSFNFFKLENKAHHKAYQMQQRESFRTIQEDYPYNKEMFDSLYLAVAGSNEPLPDNVNLTKAQFKVLVDSSALDGFYYRPGRSREWAVLWGLALLVVFVVLVGNPIYRAIGKYREDNLRVFYRWLLLPAGFAILALWAAFGVLTGDFFMDGSDTNLWLSIVSGLMLFGIVIQKSWQYLKRRKFATFFVYALPSLFIFSALVPFALAAAFIYGRQEYLRRSYGRSFFFFSGCIFLVLGGLIFSAISYSPIMLYGMAGLAPLLVLVFYGLRQQLRKLPERKAAGKSRLPSWLAILGLWILGIFSAGYFSFSLAMENLSNPDYFEDEYLGDDYYPEEEEEIPSEELGLDEVDLEEGAETDTLLEADLAETVFNTEEDQPVVTDQSPEPLNDRQQLIVDLFDVEEATRDDARRQLSRSYWFSDPELIPELIQYALDKPNVNEGLWNTLYLLEQQPDAQLLSEFELVSGFLEWMAQRGYGPSTMQRISDMQDRIGG